MEEVQEQTKEMPEQVSEPSLIERAEQANKKMTELLERQQEQINKLERLRADELLRGKSEAGSNVEKKEETAAEYATRILANRKRDEE